MQRASSLLNTGTLSNAMKLLNFCADNIIISQRNPEWRQFVEPYIEYCIIIYHLIKRILFVLSQIKYLHLFWTAGQ